MARASAVKMPPETSAAHGCEGARRVLALMLAFTADKNTLTARDLAAATGIALPSVYRYITLLRETGLLAGDERGTYRLSARLIGLARAAEAAESIIDIAEPVMRQLAAETGETVILVRLIGRTAVCVHRVQSAQRLRISFEPGQPLPLDRGASSRMLLAGLPLEQRREYLAPLAGRNPEAAARLEAKVAQAATEGYALSEEEFEKGVFAVSAPVLQGKRTIAVITVPSPLVRAPAPLQEKLRNQVRAAAQSINDGLRASRRALRAQRSSRSPMVSRSRNACCLASPAASAPQPAAVRVAGRRSCWPVVLASLQILAVTVLHDDGALATFHRGCGLERSRAHPRRHSDAG